MSEKWANPTPSRSVKNLVASFGVNVVSTIDFLLQVPQVLPPGMFSDHHTKERIVGKHSASVLIQPSFFQGIDGNFVSVDFIK